MRLPFSEIKAALQLIPELFDTHRLDLHVGGYRFEEFTFPMLKQFFGPESCDEELIGELFSERPLFWQPSLGVSVELWQTRFNLLKDFVVRYTSDLSSHDTPIDYLYASIFQHMVTQIERTQLALSEVADLGTKDQFRIVMSFRLSTYSHILFFMYHPCMPSRALQYAQNRLSLMTRALLIEGRCAFHLFQEPYWRIISISSDSSSRSLPHSSEDTSSEADAGHIQDAPQDKPTV